MHPRYLNSERALEGSAPSPLKCSPSTNKMLIFSHEILILQTPPIPDHGTITNSNAAMHASIHSFIT
ncbi:hypothetical protein EYC84_011889 [Monilinia fructicola]|uniref:Uncharacterized protein n=1 Tax=Monilinia fructicola TaxID=38448 RepID=A0A5M9J404_MONFR|nr:hypothetical protein EYC84_011889 [Monilinia fructicola]